MSVNGSGKDKRTGKDLADPTTWTVQHLDGSTAKHLTGKDRGKELAGVDAQTAFAAQRQHRQQNGVHVTPVRT